MNALACPHCGKSDKLRLKPYRADEDGGEPFDWGFTVICDASGFGHNPNRGCGASGPWGETEEEATSEWNRRAATTGRETREAVTTRPVVYISAHDVSMMVSDAMEDTVRAALEALPEPELGEKVLPLYLHPSAADTAHVRDALRVANMAFTDIAQFRPDGTGDNFQQIASHARATTLEAMPIVRRALASNGDGDE